jgi:enoyl-CoA hydratase
MADEEILIARDGGLGRIVLNRPAVLNALSPAQYATLSELLRAWQDDDGVRMVLVEAAGGKAFCCGGDIRVVWEARARGEDAANRALFRLEYAMDRRIHHYPKPYVALIDGIVMGGGAGISVNGGFRVAGPRTLFAMPEAGIGLFPDCGATWFLSRCPGRVGLYLGLSGARLGPADCLWAGIATHHAAAECRADLRAALIKAAGAGDPRGAAAETLARFHSDPGPAPLAGMLPAIDRCFGRQSPAEIMAALAEEPGDWAQDALKRMRANSPTSLAVTFRQLTAGAELDFDTAIAREYRLAWHLLTGHDLFEGIRALVVDKDKTPEWRPATLEEVSEADVDALFAPVGETELRW